MIVIKVSNKYIIVTSQWHFTRDVIISCHSEYSCDGQDACNFASIYWYQNDVFCDIKLTSCATWVVNGRTLSIVEFITYSTYLNLA